MPEPQKQELSVAAQQRKRVVFTKGGKEGVGKTGCMVNLAQWFLENQIPFTLLDLDTENKTRGSLKHYFAGTAEKVNIHTKAGLDAFVDYLSDEAAPVVLADMGAGSGEVALKWFETMHPDLAGQGIALTAIGMVTSDPVSVESVLSSAARLQDRVDYVIVENATALQSDFSYWRESEQSIRFREVLKPALSMEYRLSDLENPSRQHGATVSQIARRRTTAPELRKASLVMRARITPINDSVAAAPALSERDAAKESDLLWVDEVAALLPEDLRLGWYRKVKPWISMLAPEDEVAHLAYATGSLGLLVRSGPLLVAAERAKLAVILRQLSKEAGESLSSTVAYHRKLEERLGKLPSEIAAGLNTATFASKLTQAVRDQFLESGVPQAGTLLKVRGDRLRSLAFDQARTLTDLRGQVTDPRINAEAALDAGATREVKSSVDLWNREIRQVQWLH